MVDALFARDAGLVNTDLQALKRLQIGYPLTDDTTSPTYSWPKIGRAHV